MVESRIFDTAGEKYLSMSTLMSAAGAEALKEIKHQEPKHIYLHCCKDGKQIHGISLASCRET